MPGKISIIAALDKQYGIGKQQALLCHLPADLAYFKEKTLAKPIIMGRRTFESIGRPLPGRRNIVISSKLAAQDGIEIFASLDDALMACQESMEIMVIGGSVLYAATLPLADRLYLTRIEHQFEGVDCFFPDFSQQDWVCVSRHERLPDVKNPYPLLFEIWERD